MTPRRRRLAFVGVGLVALALTTALVLNAFQSNLVFFITPSDIAQGKAPQGRAYRVGGLVEPGSLKRESDGLTVHFVVTDLKERVEVSYTGILPDLFTEGQGAVVQGRLRKDGVFRATQVLAKHDETYMPPEVAAALGDRHQAPPSGWPQSSLVTN
ncbi:MAG: cytochrome c maturation protein CcmE [Myxococcota bacterium]